MRIGLYILMMWMGFMASASSLEFDFSASSPQVQRLEDTKARLALSEFTERVRSQPRNEIDFLNLHELDVLTAGLKDRGYEPLTERLRGHVFTAAQSLTLHKQGEQNGVWRYDLYFTQYFLWASERPAAQDILPRLRLQGYVFVDCNKTPCRIESVYFIGVDTQWGNLPADKGGNSSSGGVVKPN